MILPLYQELIDCLILYNDLGEIDVFADVTEDIIQGVVMVNHGYWVRHINGKTVNALSRTCIRMCDAATLPVYVDLSS